MLTYSESLTDQSATAGATHPTSPATEAARLLERMVSEGTIGDPLLNASMEAALCEALIRADRPEEATAAFQRAVDHAKPLGVSAMMPVLRSILIGRGHPELLDTRLGAGQSLVELVADGSLDAAFVDALFWHFDDLVESGDLATAGRLLDRLRKVRRTLADSSYLSVRIGHIEAMMCLMDAADNRTSDAIDFARAAEIRFGLGEPSPTYVRQILTLRREQGRFEDAKSLLSDFQADTGAPVSRAALAALNFDEGELARAREVFGELAKDGFDAIPKDGRRAITLAYLAEACVGLKDTTRARALYLLIQPFEGRNIVTDGVCLGSADVYLGMLSLVIKDPSTAQAHLERAIANSRQLPVWLAWAEFWLAKALGVQGEHDRASALLDQALDDSKTLGLERLRRACLNSLSKEPQLGPEADGLSPGELRVIRLLASGMTNRAIGEQLHLSPNTVANHVRNILAKTETRNRTEAANYARRHNLVPTDAPTTPD